MYKPQQLTEPKKGSKTETILHYIIKILGKNNLLFERYAELSKELSKEYGVLIDRRVISNTILRFNEGLYEFEGKNVKNFGKITLKESKSKKGDKPQTKKLNAEQLVFDIDNIKGNVKGGEIKLGWTTLPTGEKVMFKPEKLEEPEQDIFELIKSKLDEEFWDTTYKHKEFSQEGRTGVVFISDIHIGAWVEDLIKTPDYNINVIKDKLLKASKHINNMKFQKVHVMSLGDLIHSYTGTNHKNTWKGLEIGMHGPNVIKVAIEIIHEFFLSKIDNLVKVSMIAGNHCRTTQSKEEETQGGASNLVAYVLGKMGYNVEFDVKCLSEEVDGIQYILLHGDQGISKRSTKEIVWDFGKQNIYNFVAEGHLHSRIQKLSMKSKENFQTISDDSSDCRRQIMPSIFTGDEYSENNLWFSNSGFVISVNNGEGSPIVIDIPL